ncbi:hypothetical protein [Streptomyces parvulus]|uniref:hypothetical protein n=1 Tax=Streptomyces parvulus TaxID=146923 RepID=UPI003692D8B1
MTQPTNPTPDADQTAIRGRLDVAIDDVFDRWESGLGGQRPQDAIRDAVLAVRDTELAAAHDLTARTLASLEKVTERARRAEARVAELEQQTTRAADLLPAWEAVYEPGNVSDYLIGYANDQDPATGMAEAWMRSQAEVTGRLEWVADEQLATGRYDRWFELVQRHDDGVDTGPGIIVRRRLADETTDTETTADTSELLGLIRDFLDPDPCSFDHHGYCQAHGYLGGEPMSCPHGRAKKLLAELDQPAVGARQDGKA